MTPRRAFFLSILFFTGNAFGFTLQQAGLHGWSTKQITVNINYASCPLAREELEDVVDQAFEVWNAVATAHVQLVRGGNSATTAAQAFAGTATDSPVIVCDAAMSATLGTNSDQVAVAANLEQVSGTITYGYVLLNAEAGKAANLENLSNTQRAVAVAHGVGHLLGLGHSSDQSALMYFDYASKTHLRLSQDDIDGVTFLYRRVEPDEDKVFGCASVDRSGGPASRSFLGLLIFVFAILTILKRTLRNVSA